MWKRTRVKACFVFVAMLLVTAPAHALTFTFEKITNSANPDLGGQLFVDVVNGPSLGQVSFTFRNETPPPSSITEVFFEYSVLNNPLIQTNSAVNFVNSGTDQLPGGNSILP